MSEPTSSMELGSRSHSQNPNTVPDAYWKSFPPGFHFKPRDDELIIHYLKPKLFNQELPPNKITEVQLYNHNPETLVGYDSYGEGEWYFFTPRDKKYRNGSRPRRAAGDGFWKATGADRNLRSEGVEIGYRKALVFYRGKPPKGEKTEWMMHEYRLKDPPAVSNASMNEMRLDDWVLCKIYKKDRSTKTPEDEEPIGVENQCMVEDKSFDSASLVGPQLEDDAALTDQSYYHSMAALDQNHLPLLPDYPSDLAALPPFPGDYYPSDLAALPPFPGNYDQFPNVEEYFSAISDCSLDTPPRLDDHT